MLLGFFLYNSDHTLLNGIVYAVFSNNFNKILKHNMNQSNSQFNMLFLQSSVVSRCCKKETTELMLKGMWPPRKQITIHSSPWPFTQTNQSHFKDSLLSSDSEKGLYKYPL